MTGKTGLSALLFVAVTTGCGPTVVLVGPPGDGAGGTGSTPTGSSSSTSSSTSGEVASSSSSSTSSSTGAWNPPPGCVDATCGPSDSSSCSCSASCADHHLEISCAPNDKHRMQCVCVYESVFAGACFEDGDAVCDFDKSCCSKYFKGT